MKRFCVITNIYKDRNLELTDAISSYIEEKGGTVIRLLSTYKTPDPREFDFYDIPLDTEIIMVLGGDGTLIRVATKVEGLQIPLIGVNLGHLGYLCELDRENVFHALDLLMDDRYILEDRIMLRGSKKGVGERSVALNDIVIHHGKDIQTLDLNVYVNGQYLTNYKADGIIVSTPTGSTAYNMSAGGPIVDPRGNMIVLTPNNPHNLTSRSIVLTGDAVIEIKDAQEDESKASDIYVSCDGDCVATLRPGESYVILQASNRIRICKLHNRSFLEILRRKMEP